MIYRIEVASQDGQDGAAVASAVRSAGVEVGRVRVSRVFFVDSSEARDRVRELALPLLADPVVETAALLEPPGLGESLATGETAGLGNPTAPAKLAAPVDPAACVDPTAPVDPAGPGAGLGGWLEVHLKPGVMDPVAASTELALRAAGLAVRQVRTGRRFEFFPGLPPEVRRRLGSRVLGNSVIEAVHLEPYFPTAFAEPRAADNTLRHVPLTGLTDDQLASLSRSGHLFLSLTEMRAIQAWYRGQGREPTDIELETFAQTWSEHCVHKTLKSAVEVTDAQGRVRRYGNLIRDTIFASTQQLMREGLDGFCLSVFADNAGVVAFDDHWGVCFKVETHNRPSAIDPYGGSATGVGGCIRDVLGTGRGARPIANTDVFCVAYPDGFGPDRPLPPGVLHPRTTLTRVIEGVRDYGNRMGIPTVNGAVYFDDRYVANPLVFCGCVGLLPRDRIGKSAREGDAIVVIGGRTGRDGIHGATFSSAELTSTHADEFSHAVQIGNAITQKKLLDVILSAAERGLFSAITDCGAGGLSSAVGEMGERLGAEVHLERVPLKYAGLRYDEIWISEAQERMVLAVPREHVAALLELARGEDVEATVIGHYGVPGRKLRLLHELRLVGELEMEFLHDGIPMPTRKAVVAAATGPGPGWWERGDATPAGRRLLELLGHLNIASRQFIVRQYDHEVQGASVIKPLVGPAQIGPSDASVLRPVPSSRQGVALGCGLAPWEPDPYHMALLAIDEAVRNVVAVGADPSRTAILDNFCWPGTDNEQAMGELVRTAEACRDAALAYRIPFISGKDSLHNQYTDRATGIVTRIPNTLLVSALGIVPDVAGCVTMDLKRPGSRLLLLGPVGGIGSTLGQRLAVHRRVHGLIREGRVRAAHDVSDGGWLTAVAEMCIASGLGATLTTLEGCFGQLVASYVLEVEPGTLTVEPGTLKGGADVPGGAAAAREDDGVPSAGPSGAAAREGGSASTEVGAQAGGEESEVVVRLLGEVTGAGELVLPGGDPLAISRLREAWLRPLAW